MGLIVNFVKKGINYALRTVRARSKAIRTSLFDYAEGNNARRLATSLTTNPFESEQAVKGFEQLFLHQKLNPAGIMRDYFDLSTIKTVEGNYDPKKVIRLFESIKKDKNIPSLASFREFLGQFSSSNELVENYPNTVEYFLKNFVDQKPATLVKFKHIKKDYMQIIEDFLSSGSPFAKTKSTLPKDLLLHSLLYREICSAQTLKNLSKDEIAKACQLLKQYSMREYENFAKIENSLQERIINIGIKLNNTDLLQLHYIIKNVTDQNIIQQVADRPELLTKITENISQLEKLTTNSKCSDIITKKEILKELAIMKTFTPSEFSRLRKTQGFQEIIAGYTDLDLLRGVRYNSGDEFFKNIFGNIEREIEKSAVYRELEPKMQSYYKKVVMYDPGNVKKIIYLIDHAKDKALMCRTLRIANNAIKRYEANITNLTKDGFHIKPEDLEKTRRNIYELIELCYKKPEDVKFALQFDGYAENILSLAKNANKNLIPQEMVQILAQNKNKFYARHIESIIKYLKSGQDKALLDEMINRTIASKSDFTQMAEILGNTTPNNIGFIKQRIGQNNLSDLGVYAYFTKDLKQFANEANQAKILKELKNLFEIAKHDINGYNRRTIKSLIELKMNFPAKYQKLEATGIFDYIKTTGEPIAILDKITENANLSKEVLEDLKLWKEGKSIVPSFGAETSLQEAFTKTKTGDVVEVAGQMYINDGQELYRWNMTKEKYLELFPPVKRFTTAQDHLGNCYFVASLNSVMRNQKTRASLYKSFELNGNDVKVTIKAYEDFLGSVTFRDGMLELDKNKMHIQGCKGLQMFEQTYAQKALRQEVEDITGSVIAENKQKLMSRLTNGHINVVMNELLGLTHNETSIPRLPQELHNTSVRIFGTNMPSTLEQALKKFGNNPNYILGFGTVPKPNSASESLLLPQYSLVSTHAYSITGYNAEKGIVTISNPLNCSLDFDIPLETLKKYIQTVHITALT